MKKLNLLITATVMAFGFTAMAAPGGKGSIAKDMKVISESYRRLGNQITNKKMNRSSQAFVLGLLF